MHMVCELPGDVLPGVLAAAAARGWTWPAWTNTSPATTRHGLVLGYGAADLAGVSRGCQVLAEILAGLPAGRAGPIRG